MKIRIFKTVMLGIGLLTISFVSAQKAETTTDNKAKFEKIDANTDGKISLKEYNTHRAALRVKKGKEAKEGDYSRRFNQIDIDQDGFINKEEFKNRKATRPEKKVKVENGK